MGRGMAERAPLPPARHEPRDIGPRFVLLLLCGIGGGLLLMLGIALLIYPDAIRDERFARPFPDYPSPRLQPSPPDDMAAYRARERAWLHGFGWQDKAAGRVRMPIEQAMRAVATQGIPGWPAGPTRIGGGAP